MEVPINDVFALALPEGIDPEDPGLLPELYEMAVSFVWAQYDGADRPNELRIDIDWLITGDADEADAFQPAHDCPSCVAGADQMRAFLRDHPGRVAVLANLHYVEVWPG
jgi:hypothetical protein